MDFIFAQSQPVQGGGILSFLPFLLIMVILYFFMLRPQAKKQKEKQEMINKLNKGDKVITIGGVHAKIIDIKEDTFIIEGHSGTILKIEKSAVSMSPDSRIEQK